MSLQVGYRQLAALGSIVCLILAGGELGWTQTAPAPLVDKSKPSVNWWFAFKFSAKSFPNCASGATRSCVFGGNIQPFNQFSQQFVFANSGHSAFTMGGTCIGDTVADPVGATFDQVYNGSHNYVIWNDQFYRDPDLAPCHQFGYCETPWAHSKGMLAWDNDGNGFVMQVSTPNWPGSGSKDFPRQTNGNTLGCTQHNTGAPHNNVLVSQHFFAVKLTKDDVVTVLKALVRASVVTTKDAALNSQSQLIKNGGPSDIQDLVKDLGRLSQDTTVLRETLLSGVQIIAKPPLLHVPPWHMASALLGHEPLVVATWWTGPDKIQDTAAMTPSCWAPSLGSPGTIRNAERGLWQGKSFGLTGGTSPDRNHAKLGVSKTGKFVIFGDFNNEGAVAAPCDHPQNTRGGLFYVVEDQGLADSVRDLLDSHAPSPNARRRRHR